MKKKLLMAIIPFFLSGHQVISQSAFVDAQMSDFMGQVNKNHQINPTYAQIEGSPYYNDEFIEGEIYFDEKYRLARVPMRINLYNGEIEFKHNNMVMAVANPARINKIILDKDKFIFLGNKKKGEVSGLLKMWNPEKPAIVTQMEIEYKPKEKPRAFEDAKPDRFDRLTDKHYLMTKNDELVTINSVKKLIKELGDHQDELSSFSKSEKISSGNVKELAQLLDYYHSLQ